MLCEGYVKLMVYWTKPNILKSNLDKHQQPDLRWLNIVLWAVSDNSRDGACFKLDKQTWRRKKQWYTEICSLKFCDTWQNFYFYRTFNNKNFKMEIEQTNFVTHLKITVKSYYWLSKNPSVKIWSNKVQMVMINHSKLCASL